MKLARTLLSTVLVGVAISAVLLVFILLSMLARYSKGLNEVIACWQYITAAVVVAVLAVRGVIELHFTDS